MRELTGKELDAVCGGAFSWNTFYSKLTQKATAYSDIDQGGFHNVNTATVNQVAMNMGSIEVNVTL